MNRVPYEAQSGLILAVETSCDETGAAVVAQGTDIRSNVVASQIALHANFGGVVPELAAREHLRNIVPVVREAMREAGVEFAALDALAVTEGPGLAGALLVGITYAQALAWGLAKPLIAVNHLEGHIHAVLMERQHERADEERVLALVVSGGHTHLYLAELRTGGLPRYREVGRTVDDAAGEAFDKVGKLLGLPFPGGPAIDALAPEGNPRAVAFQFHAIKPREDAGPGARFDFSFSGIKSAVLRHVQSHGMEPAIAARRTLAGASRPEQITLDLLASFQAAIVGNLLRQTFRASEHFGSRSLIVCGGVAANRELRRRFTAEAARRGMTVDFPRAGLSTDNAAMIAAAAWPKLCAGELAPESLTATPQLRLG